MKRFILLFGMILLSACVTTQPTDRSGLTAEPQAKIVFQSETPRPEWTIGGGTDQVPGKVSFLGSAQNKPDERSARGEAEQDALAAFARYCGVDAKFVQEALTVQQTGEHGIIESTRTAADVSKVESEVSVSGAFIDKTYLEKYATKGTKTEPARSYCNYWVLLAVPQREYQKILQKKDDAEKEREVRNVTEFVPVEGEQWFNDMGTLEDEQYIYRWEHMTFEEGQHMKAAAMIEKNLREQFCKLVGVGANDPGGFYPNPGVEVDRGFSKVVNRVAGYKAPQKTFLEGEYYLRAKIAKTRVAEVRTVLDKLRQEAVPVSAEIGFYVEAYVKGQPEKVFKDNGDVVRTGEQFKVSVKPNQDVHVYIINKDASGNLNVLFPSPRVISVQNPVRGGFRTDIPRDELFQFDDVAGDEEFSVYLTRNESAELQELCRKSQAGALTTADMALVDVKYATAGTATPTDAPDILSGSDYVMRKWRFRHVQ